jgi:DNA ligase
LLINVEKTGFNSFQGKKIMIFSCKGGLIVRSVVIALLLIIKITSFSHGQVLQKPGVYKGNEEIENWLMSEKLDGIRGYWNGENLQTRKGNLIHAPEWFLRNFPPFELDGELWSDRNQFEFIQSVVLDKKPSENWRKITYNIFEVPNTDGDFNIRLQKASEWFFTHQNQYVRIIPQIKCENRGHLQRFLKEIELIGGEGVIVKDPLQDYHTGRSSHVLKVKNINDMEGAVIGINPGKGKFENMMGSLTLKLKNGLIFKLGTGFSNKARKNPPKVGSVVTFKYYGFTKKGVPKFASFLRVRKD